MLRAHRNPRHSTTAVEESEQGTRHPESTTPNLLLRITSSVPSAAAKTGLVVVTTTNSVLLTALGQHLTLRNSGPDMQDYLSLDHILAM